MSVDKTEHNEAQDVSTMPCPACIEAASVIKEGQEFVPEYALHKYTFEQLDDQLNSNRNNRDQLVEVAMRQQHFSIVSHMKRQKAQRRENK